MFSGFSMGDLFRHWLQNERSSKQIYINIYTKHQYNKLYIFNIQVSQQIPHIPPLLHNFPHNKKQIELKK